MIVGLGAALLRRTERITMLEGKLPLIERLQVERFDVALVEANAFSIDRLSEIVAWQTYDLRPVPQRVYIVGAAARCTAGAVGSRPEVPRGILVGRGLRSDIRRSPFGPRLAPPVS